LRAVYELVDGRRYDPCFPQDISAHANVEGHEVEETLRYLQDEGLIEQMASNHVVITHRGIVEYEAALRAPDKGTEHFTAPVILNVTATNIGAIISGDENTTSIQQQHNQGPPLKELGRLLDQLSSHVDTIDGEDRAKAAIALAGIRCEIEKPTPTWETVKASLKYLETFTKLAGIVKAMLMLFTG
jgi:hypothetical protein